MSENSNTRQAAWVAMGSLFSFGFGLVSSMILSRYFEKTDYGTYKQVLYVYNTLLSVFTLGLPKAYSYFLPRVKDSQAKDLIKKINNLFFLLGGTFSVVLFIGAPVIARLMNNTDLVSAVRIFSVVPLLMLPTMGLEGILATYKQTKFMALYTIITRLVMLICVSFPVIFWNGGYIDAIIGFDIASVISFILALYYKYYPVKNSGKEASLITFREIFSFSIPLLFASLWGVIIQSADQFFVSRYFGSEVFAEFSNGAMDLPFVGIIISACATVLSPVFSRLSYEQVDFKKDVLPLWLSVYEKTAKLVYPLVLYCLVFADIVMAVLYGDRYVTSSVYFQIKLIANFFMVISFAPLLINTGNVKFYQDVHLYGAILLVVLEFLSVYFFQSPYVLTAVSVVCHIGRIIVLLLMVAKIFGVKFHQIFPLRLIAKIIIPSLLILLLIRFLFDTFLPCDLSAIIVFVVTFALYCILYLMISFLLKIDYISIVKPLFN